MFGKDTKERTRKAKMAHMAVVSKGKVASKIAKPLLSTNNTEARTRVLNLYRAWLREVIHILSSYVLNLIKCIAAPAKQKRGEI